LPLALAGFPGQIAEFELAIEFELAMRIGRFLLGKTDRKAKCKG